MPYPHTIRLRGPWQFSVLSCAAEQLDEPRDAPEASRGRVNLPADWSETLGADFRGNVRYTRHFNRPSNLDPHEHVWCVIDGIDPAANVALNGHALGNVTGYAMPASFNITSLLQDRNELTLDVEMPASSENQTPRPGREQLPGGPIGEVRLEIRAGNFLEGLSVYAINNAGAPELHVAGQVAGEPSSSPLAVVVNVREHELLFGEFLPGEFFDLHAPAADLPSREPSGAACRLATVEIRLLSGGASVWQVARETAVERIAWNADERRLSIAGETVTFPLPILSVAGLEPPSRAQVETEFATVWSSRQILSEQWYSVLDRQNVRLVQLVPIAWAPVICPRLAHHPSIVAWAADSEDWARLPKTFPDWQSSGRSWISAEEAFADL